MSTWRPLGTRQDAELAERWDALHEGVPAWLSSSLLQWLRDYGEGISKEWLRVERGMRADAMDFLTFRSQVERCDDDVIPQIDAILGLALSPHLDDWGWPYRAKQAVVDLGTILTEAGSAWAVGFDSQLNCAILERRVPEGVVEAAQAVIATANDQIAGHLTAAWNHAFGVAPNPTHAYSSAVKAVEAAAIPVVAPADSTATLGKIRGQLRGNPEQWSVNLGDVDVLVDMITALWEGQSDRHGDAEPDYSTVTASGAQAAVHLAVTLVAWFAGGAVARSS